MDPCGETVLAFKHIQHKKRGCKNFLWNLNTPLQRHRGLSAAATEAPSSHFFIAAALLWLKVELLLIARIN